jgi:hypothetical protein
MLFSDTLPVGYNKGKAVHQGEEEIKRNRLDTPFKY